jgi:hypothetical protein
LNKPDLVVATQIDQLAVGLLKFPFLRDEVPGAHEEKLPGDGRWEVRDRR